MTLPQSTKEDFFFKMIGVIGTLYGFCCIFSILATGTCICKQGFAVSSLNSSECVDVDECRIFGSCSQFCENTVGSFQCSCMEGFEVAENDKGSCSPIDTKWNLVYTTRYDVGYIAKSNTGSVQKYQLTQNKTRPRRVTYDARNNIIYWTDASTNATAIYKRYLTGPSNIEVVADAGMLLPQGIAFDWITGNIYFVDSKLSHIAICGNVSNLCAVLVLEKVDKPRDIALHPNLGIMFWTDWGKTPAIMRAGMDGTLPLAIVSSDVKWSDAITVDQGNDRIYWVDVQMDRIETTLFDGSDRHIVPTGITRHPFGIDVFGDRIFWSDWITDEIKSENKFSGFNGIVHLADPGTVINEVALFHVANQPILRSNPCEKSRCSHICALSPTSSYRCFCPVGMVLGENGRNTCVVCDGSANCTQNEDEEILGDNRSKFTGMQVMEKIEADECHGTTTTENATVTIVVGIIIIVVLVAIIIALVLDKRNIQAKVLVRPYFQQNNGNSVLQLVSSTNEDDI